VATDTARSAWPPTTIRVPQAGAAIGPDPERMVLVHTDASTFRYTGTRIFVAANSDKLFSAIAGSGTFTRTTAHSTETDTITGGTGRFTGAIYGDTSASGSPMPSHLLAGR
jgi:hypothetical protein